MFTAHFTAEVVRCYCRTSVERPSEPLNRILSRARARAAGIRITRRGEVCQKQTQRWDHPVPVSHSVRAGLGRDAVITGIRTVPTVRVVRPRWPSTLERTRAGPDPA